MTSREEIERLLNQTGRTLEGLPEEHTMAERIDATHRPGEWCEIVLHQSDVIELLVSALRDALDKPRKKPMTHDEAESILKNGDPVWCEERDELWAKDHWIKPIGVNDGYLDKLMYGHAWRCWASRPTDEERAAAPWEDDTARNAEGDTQ